MVINFNRILEESGLKFIFRMDDLGLWDETLVRLEFSPANLLASSINYQLTYHRERGGEWWDISCIIFWDNSPVGIWPLTVSKGDSGEISLSSHGLLVAPPRFIRDCPSRTRKKILTSCLDAVNKMAAELGLMHWGSRVNFSGSYELSQWHLESMARGAICSVKHDLYIDLRASLSEIKSNFRRSYRSLVSPDRSLWTIEIVDGRGGLGAWNEFQELHLKVSGRRTRSEKTWILQYEAIVSGEGFLIALRNSNGAMVGGGYFICSIHEGFYAVGAYDRDLFDQPLGHIVQWQAITELKKRGCIHYYLGDRCYQGDSVPPTQKELSIAHFKEGFAMNVYPSFSFNHPVFS
jgi:FemAB family protein